MWTVLAVVPGARPCRATRHGVRAWCEHGRDARGGVVSGVALVVCRSRVPLVFISVNVLATAVNGFTNT